MTDQIDPRAKADEILSDVKAYFDFAAPRDHAVEDSVTASNALDKVKQEIGEVWKDPQLLAAIAKEFEVTNDEMFSVLPGAKISEYAGNVTEVEFRSSGWDLHGIGHGLIVQEKEGGGHQLDFFNW
jgi:hypothetical protein